MHQTWERQPTQQRGMMSLVGLALGLSLGVSTAEVHARCFGDEYEFPLIEGGVINAQSPTFISEFVLPQAWHGQIEGLEVHLHNLTHTWVGDLIVTLTHVEAGKTITLFSKVGDGPFGDSSDLGDIDGRGLHYVYWFMDKGKYCCDTGIWYWAEKLGPEESIHSTDSPPMTENQEVLSFTEFAGNTAGTWRLTIQDTYPSADHGALGFWTLYFDYTDVQCPNSVHHCFEQGSPGCASADCCATICAVDGFCCAEYWDQICVDEAKQLCGGWPNDECSAALPIGLGDTFFSTIGATTSEPAVSNCGSSTILGADTWYVYDADCSGTLKVDTCNSADFDTMIAIYEENSINGFICPNPLLPGFGSQLVACTDDTEGCGFTSVVSTEVERGKSYTIRVGGYVYPGGPSEGTGVLTLTCEPSGVIGDVDGNRLVNAADLGLLLGSWGTASVGADFNDSGLVDGADLALLLGAWTG